MNARTKEELEAVIQDCDASNYATQVAQHELNIIWLQERHVTNNIERENVEEQIKVEKSNRQLL